MSTIPFGRSVSKRLAILFFLILVSTGDLAAAKDDSERSFSDVVKNADVTPGLFTIYRKEDKVYLEILPSQFGQLFLCSPTISSGIGERSFLSTMMLPEFVWSFHKMGKTVQLQQVNMRYRAAENAPVRKAVQRSFSNSVLASGKMVSQPHPDRRSILVDLNNFMISDLPLLGFMLENEYRIPYRLDANNSGITLVKGFDENVEIGTMLNFAVDRPAAQSSSAVWPVTTPDVRSLQFGVNYSLSLLKETDYRPRLADDRIGHFVAMYQDFTDDRRETPYVRYITRWKLEKEDPAAKVSPPKEPIVFWLENSIPEKYRKSVSSGVLVWNRAFERIGIKDAIVVKQQPADADWDAADVRYNTIRWFVSTDASFAIAPIRVNPLTGQIYDADIGFSENLTRISRNEFEEFVAPATDTSLVEKRMQYVKDPRFFCDFSNGAIQQASFGLGLLESRGLLTDQEHIDEYVQNFVTHIIAHEVGHALGLRHNFQASTLNSFDRLHDPSYTKEHGLSGSMMDYTPVNLAPAGQKQGQCWQTSLGPYDYWAIEYAYKLLPAKSTEEELPELKKIASRVAEPALAFGTDEDALFSAPTGIDPRSTRWDYSSDPLEYYGQRMKLVQELWRDLETRVGRSGDRYQLLRRSFNQGFSELYLDMINASKYVGGIYNNRDHIGDPGGRLPYEPVPSHVQRKALELIKTHAFGSESFHLPPRLLNQLAMERFWTFEGNIFNAARLDYPIHQQVLRLQKTLLDRLYHPVLLSRLQDLEVKYTSPQEAFTMADLFEGVREAVWVDVKKGDSSMRIDSFRRGLQREHLKKLADVVLSPEFGMPEDARTMARYSLTQVKARLEKSVSGPNINDVATRAHLEDSLALIQETLKAQQIRFVN